MYHWRAHCTAHCCSASLKLTATPADKSKYKQSIGMTRIGSVHLQLTPFAFFNSKAGRRSDIPRNNSGERRRKISCIRADLSQFWTPWYLQNVSASDKLCAQVSKKLQQIESYSKLSASSRIDTNWNDMSALDPITVHSLSSKPTEAWDLIKGTPGPLQPQVMRFKVRPPTTPTTADKVRVVCISDTHSLTSHLKRWDSIFY